MDNVELRRHPRAISTFCTHMGENVGRRQDRVAISTFARKGNTPRALREARAAGG
ncbi:MAG: hypothetical protein ACAH82_17610 [Solirubrobacteraceae bacterium]